MKKKIITFLCVIACLISVAGCGGVREYSEVEQEKMQYCTTLSNELVDLLSNVATEDYLKDITTNYKKHESALILQSMTSNYYPVSAEFGVFEGMLTTYIQTEQDMKGIESIGETPVTEIVGREIVVTYDVYGKEANGTIKFKYTNDLYTKLTAAEATANLTVKQNLHKAAGSMKNAGLNTLLGMGTVFSVLILISLIISSFNLFKKKDKPAPVKEAKVAPVAETVEENLADDTELVAVIMAAISAFEGTSSTDGLVVRSIRRANRRN